MSLTLDIDLPTDLARFRLPAGVAARLQSLLDQQDAGRPLTAGERAEAEGLVDMADLLSLLRLRAERAMLSTASRSEMTTTTLEAARREIVRYATDREISLTISEVYDLFPAQPCATAVTPAMSWPDRWPQGERHGVYLFFSDAPSEPGLVYVGRSSKPSSRIRVRLNGYVDMAEYRISGRCVLREEWNGYRRPWGTAPRYVVTVAADTHPLSGACPEAELLERHLIRVLRPSENVVGRVESDSTSEESV